MSQYTETRKQYKETNREKVAAMNAAWYQKNKELILQRWKDRYAEKKEEILASNRERKENRKKVIDGIALHYGCQNSSCKWEGEFHPSQLQFHHLDPQTKVREIGLMGAYGKKTIADELNKCVVLCANCHALVHMGLAEVGPEHLCRVNENLEIKELVML